VPQRTLDLVHLRASQINGCSVCLGAAVKARNGGRPSKGKNGNGLVSGPSAV
jgi:alkylhydroperoxidase family enzyme